MGLILIALALGAIWWLERHPDLDLGIGAMIFGLSWVTGLAGIYLTLRTYWI